MFTTYDSQGTFEHAVADCLGKSDLPEGLRGSIVAGLLSAEEARHRERSSSSDLEFRLGRWFLRTRDAPFLESLATASALAVSATSGESLTAASIVAVTNFAGCAWRVWRSGGRLSDNQLVVLATLEAVGPVSHDNLLAVLKDRGVEINSGQLQLILSDLTECELNDGTAAPLVRLSADSRWRCLRM